MKRLCNVNADSEIIYQRLNYDTKKKYAADSPFFHSVVPYLMLFLCGTIDFFVFKSMFNMISYDDDIMKGFCIAGLLFGFDILPIFIGIQARRLRQGLNRDRFVLLIALAVTVLTVTLNIGLRIAAMDEMSPEDVSVGVSYFGSIGDAEDNMETGTETEDDVDTTALALALFGCFLPVLTSAGSFCISYLTYDPLMIRKRRAEILIHEKKDEIRRFNAILFDYEADAGLAERLRLIDEGKYRETFKLQIAKVMGYCDYVRQCLKEHLAAPTANNALSVDEYEIILGRLDAELAALDDLGISESFLKTVKKDITGLL